ncbi:pyridoxal-dependent decarboxylase [Pseudoxanthobacter sp.]|uniref:pyridoxal phosphate-dependent decarboxylase family protein n=1 Tax=Pseudoxanthobacter sp. TaxID=1925742 RepID=UPI002FE28459
MTEPETPRGPVQADLDPRDWPAFRSLAHRMLDDMIDHVAHVRDRPVWQPMPAALRAELHAPLDDEAAGLEAAYEDFSRLIAPYSTGNLHPLFMGWVHGGGNPAAMMGELLAAGLNANLGGRDHAPIELERQVIRWAARMLGFPDGAGGLMVTGSSMANFMAVLAARRHMLGPAVRRRGLGEARLVAYAQTGVHACLPRAMDMAGIGADCLRRIPADADRRMNLGALESQIAADLDAGLTPFLIAGTAGTVDSGAFDDLAGLARIARARGLWFHVDAAFGAFAALSPKLKGLVEGIANADSAAFDFHKWGQVQYDAGCLVVRDQQTLLDTFAQNADYLSQETRGLAAGAPWPCDLGPDLSRSFRALKVWMTIRTHGAEALGRVVEACCERAAELVARIADEPRLELLAPAPLNVVCFRVRDDRDADGLNHAVVIALQESGLAAPSTTRIGGALAIRCAFVNHRTVAADIHRFVDALLATADRLLAARDA